MLVNLDDVLKSAQREHYGVGLFNTTDTDMLQAAIEAAESLKSPIILGTAEVLLPYGDLPLIAPALLAAAQRASVPVVVHYDHGLTFERTMQALKLGFSSVMFDASAKPYDENIAATKEVVKIAHAMGATVEGEIGHVGLAQQGDNEDEDRYTTPEEAVAFQTATGVDALAVAIGTAHGVYKSKPKLNLERLRAIHDAAQGDPSGVAVVEAMCDVVSEFVTLEDGSPIDATALSPAAIQALYKFATEGTGGAADFT